jgi:hypothetical protein
MIDYRALLLKYIQHVGDCEGVDFISHVMPVGDGSYQTDWGGDTVFTAEEYAELQKLGRE